MEVQPVSQFMTVAEAASALHVGAQTVRAWIRDGRLPAIKVGNKVWHVPTEATHRSWSEHPGGREP